MLYPAGLRIILCEFLLGHAADLALFIEQDTPVAGRACIQSHYVFCHKKIPPFFCGTPFPPVDL
jgi:hypothetical protein